MDKEFRKLLDKLILDKADKKYNLRSGDLLALLSMLKDVKENELTFFKTRKNYHKIKADAYQEVITFIEYVVQTEGGK